MTAAELDEEVELPTVRALFVEVMRSVRVIEKSSYNRDQKYHFRGIEAVLDVVGPLVREHGLIVLPEQTVIVAEERYQSKAGSAMRSVTVQVTWSITGPAGDEMIAQTLGEAADASDKAIAKAQSVAGRVLWLTGLWVPTGDPDPDEQTHERAPQQQRPRGRRQPERESFPASEPPGPVVGGPLRKALAADITRIGTTVLRLSETELHTRFAQAHGTTLSEATADQLRAFRDALREQATTPAQRQEDEAELARTAEETAGQPQEEPT